MVKSNETTNKAMFGGAGLCKLFPDSFIQTYTCFKSIYDLFDCTGFKYECQEEFDAIDKDKLDEFIRNHTVFLSWDNMKTVAEDLK
jgi:hypothetical protein